MGGGTNNNHRKSVEGEGRFGMYGFL